MRADRLPTAHGIDRLLERSPLQAMLLEQPSSLSLVIAGREQKHLAGDELVAAFLRGLVGEVKQVGKITPDLHFAAVAFDLGQTLDRILQCCF